jgi:coatomer subunit beta
VGSLPIFN